MDNKRVDAFIKSAYAQGKPPSAENLSRWTKLPLEEAAQAIKNWKERNITIEPAVPIKPTAIQKIANIHQLPKEWIKLLCVVIALLASIRSFGYILAWFPIQDFMSIITSASVVLAYTVFPQATIALWAKNKMAASLLIFLSVVVIAFSMGATVNALWNERTAHLVSAKQGVKSDSDGRASLESRISYEKDLDYQKTVLQNEITTVTEQRNKEEPLSAAYNKLDRKVVDARNKLEATQAKIQENQKAMEELRAKIGVEIRSDFLETSNLEVYFYIALSIIIDLAGPVALSVALFL